MLEPCYCADNISLYSGDLRVVLPQALQPNTVDFVVTDPPYGLSFMERDWDHEVPGPEYWRVIANVCKPGALLLAFGGTRTYHRLTCAIEDAGWEIRDSLLWLFGQDARLNDLWESLDGHQRKLFADLISPGQVLAWLQGQGFPKAADVGKMIDKAKGAKREVVGTKVGLPGYSLADNGRTNDIYGDLHDPQAECAITAPATPEAARWTGWANALKPAWEPIILAMKPMDGTIAHNALTHGVAGMNIDAGRIRGDGPSPSVCRRASSRASGNAPMQSRTLGVETAAQANEMGKIGRRGSAEVYQAERPSEALGRWPANLFLDEGAAVRLDA